LKSQIQSLEVTYLVHATEDPAKLEKAMGDLLGKGLSAESQRFEGHFGNEITMVRIHVTGTDAEQALSRVFTRMPWKLRGEILSGIRSFVDEHSALYVRLDKQALVDGRLALGGADPVRVKVKPRLFLMKGGAGDFYANLLGGTHGE
jgi:RNA binding exosome subunit